MDIWGLSSRHGHFTPRNETPVPIEQGGWVPKPVSTCQRIENLLPLRGVEPRAVQPVAYRLRHSGSRTVITT